MPSLGIVVPVYNKERELDKCIESIENQSFQNWKLILVDDGSDDSSGDLCDRFAKKDNRIRVIHQNNQGPNAARRAGLESLDTDYISFVDADDWIAKDTYLALEDYMNEGVECIQFKTIRYYADDRQEEDSSVYQDVAVDEGIIKNEILPIMIWSEEKDQFGIDPALWNKVIKRSLYTQEFEEAKDLDITYGEDAAIIYPLFVKLKSYVYVNKGVYYQRVRARSEHIPYLEKDSFYRDLARLYDYLIGRLPHTGIFLKQLDFFMLNSVEKRIAKCGGRRSLKEKSLFPFDKVTQKSNIILYGAGEVGQIYKKQFDQISYGNIVCWVDKQYEKYADQGVCSPEVIKKQFDYDYVVIAIKANKAAEMVRAWLIEANVPKEKIVWSI